MASGTHGAFAALPSLKTWTFCPPQISFCIHLWNYCVKTLSILSYMQLFAGFFFPSHNQAILVTVNCSCKLMKITKGMILIAPKNFYVLQITVVPDFGIRRKSEVGAKA